MKKPKPPKWLNGYFLAGLFLTIALFIHSCKKDKEHATIPNSPEQISSEMKGWLVAQKKIVYCLTR